MATQRNAEAGTNSTDGITLFVCKFNITPHIYAAIAPAHWGAPLKTPKLFSSLPHHSLRSFVKYVSAAAFLPASSSEGFMRTRTHASLMSRTVRVLVRCCRRKSVCLPLYHPTRSASTRSIRSSMATPRSFAWQLPLTGPAGVTESGGGYHAHRHNRSVPPARRSRPSCHDALPASAQSLSPSPTSGAVSRRLVCMSHAESVYTHT
jgi:hypothetical protein